MSQELFTPDQPDATPVSGNVPARMATLIADLECRNVYRCRRARRILVTMGEDAVPYLVDVLKHRKGWSRWEAAKALGQIPGPTATQALIDALEDSNFDIRWLAAEGLIHRGNDALVPLVQTLISKSESAYFREGAHHVLTDFSHTGLRSLINPMLEALEGTEPGIGVPLQARKLLSSLQR